MNNKNPKPFLTVREGDILELCFERFGRIEPYVVEAVQHRGQPEEGYGYNNSFYVRVRKAKENDNIVLKEKVGKDRFYKVKEITA